MLELGIILLLLGAAALAAGIFLLLSVRKKLLVADSLNAKAEERWRIAKQNIETEKREATVKLKR